MDDVMTFLKAKIKKRDEELLSQFAERIKMEFYAYFDELIPSIMADKIDEIKQELLNENE